MAGVKKLIPMAMLAALCLVLSAPQHAQAKRFVAVKDGKTVVVHTNPAPVIVHRVLPPYGLGKHVYAPRQR